MGTHSSTNKAHLELAGHAQQEAQGGGRAQQHGILAQHQQAQRGHHHVLEQPLP